MKLNLYIKTILAPALAAAFLCGCSKIDSEFSAAGKTPLETPAIQPLEVTTSSISFSWSSVADAGQYYYQVLNPSGYTVAKGLTEDLSVTVKSLKFSTAFQVYVNAVPDAAASKTRCSSAKANVTMTTEDPIIIDYEWVQDGYAYFNDWEGTSWNKCDVTVGREKETGHFIITSWCGAEGFDLYFDIKDFDGTYPLEFSYSTPVFQPVVGQAIDQVGLTGSYDGMQLSHGLGGKTLDYIFWYGKGMSYDYGLIDKSGGYIDLSVKDYDGTWCGYRVEFGNYEPEPEPEPEPDPDPEESFEGTASVTFNDTEICDASMTFDSETGRYTITGWFGVEGYDLSFTRNPDSGDWIVDEDCSAYAGRDGEGRTGLYHGIGRAAQSICWVDSEAWSSGMTGNAGIGSLTAGMTGPDGTEGTYTAAWDNQSANNPWTAAGTAYYGDAESDDLTPITSSTISYDPDSGKYTIKAFYGVEGYDLVFTASAGVITLDSQYSGGSVPVGFTGTKYSCCYFYDYNTFTGTPKKGNVELWMYNPDGVWCGYYFYWDNTPGTDKVWYASGTSYFGDDHTMETQTTMKYDPLTGKYTIYNWWGVEGYDFVFTLNGDSEVVPDDSYTRGTGDAVQVPHGLTEQTYDWCTFYTTAGYSSFSLSGKSVYGWIYDPSHTWDYWEFDW